MRFLVLFRQCFTFFLIFIKLFCCALEKLNASRKLPGAISAWFGRQYTSFVHMEFGCPKKAVEKKKKKTGKKTCELKVYLCILESVISSEFSLYFNQRFNKNLLKVHPCKVRMNVKNIERESMTHFYGQTKIALLTTTQFIFLKQPLASHKKNM